MTLELAKLYRNTFGYVGIPWDNTNVENYVPLLRLGSTGKVFSMPTKVKAKESDSWYELPNEPLISIDGSKQLIRTPIDGNNGTFKESFGLNDYVIRIQGIAIDDTNTDDYPSDQVYAIRNLFEEGKSILILNELCTIFGIDYFSVETIRIPGIEGAQSFQPYELTGYSDRNFELIVRK
jgi:hypothetical protein